MWDQQSASHVPLKHLQRVGMTANVRMNSHWETEIVVCLVEVVEMVLPEILYDTRMNPTMAIGHVLDKHLLMASILVNVPSH